MHIISNEHALAHWRTLCMLSNQGLDFLEARFMEEQPIVAQAVAELTDATGASVAAWRLAERDPRLHQFGQILTRAACLHELFRREARHALRKLEEAEVSDLVRANLDTTEALVESPALNGPDLFTTSKQPELLRGIVIGHLSVEGTSDREGQALLILRFLLEALHRACGDAPPDRAGDWDAGRIVIALSVQGDPLRREALAACDAFRAKLVPVLLKELNGWASDPVGAREEDGSLGTHAMFLLAKWREKSAWPVFRKLFSLPGGTGYDLLGDLITEDGSTLLAMVGGSRRADLCAMAEDEQVDEYCRNACLDALTCLVAWGERPRTEHVAYLRELLTGKLREMPANDHVFAGVVSAACDLEAWELRPEVEAAFARGAVEDSFVDLKFFLDCANGKRRSQWDAFCERHQPITDVAKATKWLDKPPEINLPREVEEEGTILAPAIPYIAPPKVGRNDPCPCGSGKKFKKCCGG